MKVVIQFDKGDGFEYESAIMGFECDNIVNLEAAIREMAARYLNDLDAIEAKVNKIYKLKRIGSAEMDRRVDEIRRTPYLLRAGKYVLWAGDFIVYRFDGNGMVRRYMEPDIKTLEDWFESIAEKGSGLH
jgi:hypothetical protein